MRSIAGWQRCYPIGTVHCRPMWHFSFRDTTHPQFFFNICSEALVVLVKPSGLLRRLAIQTGGRLVYGGFHLNSGQCF